MLGTPRNPPKVVTVKVNRASGLKNVYVESKKHRKENFKWKVKIKGGKKTMQSYIINEPNGNPVWDFEATFEIADVSQPVVLKVTDSDDHHVGQVVIPLVQIPPRPSGSTTRPSTTANLRVAELEPTKKVSQVYGSLYYWIWAESYYDDFGPEKSSRASILSSDRVHRSASRISAHLHRHRDKEDGTSVVGSTLSMYSTASGKKKHWYQKNPIKHIHGKHGSGASHISSKHGSELGYSMSQSMNSLFPQQNDGSVLGSHSGNGSDIYGGSGIEPVGGEFKAPRAENPFPRAQSNLRTSQPPSSADEVVGRSEVAPEPTKTPLKRLNKRPITSNLTEKAPSSASSDEGVDIRAQSPPPTFTHLSAAQEEPILLSLFPSTGPPNAETEVHVYGKNLKESVMLHAVLLIDDYTVASYNWNVSEGSWSEEPRATHRITLKVPSKKDFSGNERVWIEVETMSHGRLRCPTPFVYQANEKPPVADQPVKLPQAGLIRNTSIRLSDSRARRSIRKPEEGKPVKATNPLTTEKSSFVRNSSIRLSDTRARRSTRSAKQTPPVSMETTNGTGNRSSGLGSEDSFSENNLASNTIYSADEVHLDSLADAEEVIVRLRGEVADLTTKLSSKTADVDRISSDFCRLRVRLLEDGMFKYLEKY